MTNKRKHQRIKAKGLVSHLQAAGEGLALGQLVENVSMRGMFVRTSEPLPVGTPLILELVKPGLKKAIKVAGRVANTVTLQEATSRKCTPGMGIRFDPLDPEISARLESL